MSSRRNILIGVGSAIAASGAGMLAWPGDDPAYHSAARDSRRRIETWPDAERALIQALVGQAVLAASSHNTQPWLFEAAGTSIRIARDVSRRCPVVDPEDRHLIASLGCAVENLVLAAAAAGFAARVQFDAVSRGAVVVMDRSRPEATAAYAAIVERQSTRAPFASAPLSTEDLNALDVAARKPGVRSRLLTTRGALNQLKDFIVAGNTAQCNDAAFVRELGDWVRFNQTHAAETRDGLYSGSSGNPALPRWLGRHAFPFVFTAGSENPKYAAQIEGSAGAMVLYAEDDGPEGWFNVGRASQRFQLEATARGIRSSFVNQPVEVAAVRADFG